MASDFLRVLQILADCIFDFCFRFHFNHIADEDILNRTYQIFSEKIGHVEYLIGYEGNAFAFTGNVEEDLLSIMAVHPMRKEAIYNFLIKANANWSVIEKLLHQNKLINLSYQGNEFYLRKLEVH